MRWISGRGRVVTDESGEPLRMLGTAQDITERKLHEAELHRLNAELQARLADLATSRARIVAAGGVERRRLERNLHDGAQQRLVTLSITLRVGLAKLERSGVGWVPAGDLGHGRCWTEGRPVRWNRRGASCGRDGGESAVAVQLLAPNYPAWREAIVGPPRPWRARRVARSPHDGATRRGTGSGYSMSKGIGSSLRPQGVGGGLDES